LTGEEKKSGGASKKRKGRKLGRRVPQRPALKMEKGERGKPSLNNAPYGGGEEGN